MILPSLSRMWSQYPRGEAAQVKKKIGGRVNAAWITNTCVVRVSHALNKCNYAIPRGYPGLLVVSGANKKWYALRVAEFGKYMLAKHGAPIKGKDAKSFEGKQGLMMFVVHGWSDATGHFDLWDGTSCAGSDYFDKSTDISLWEC